MAGLTSNPRRHPNNPAKPTDSPLDVVITILTLNAPWRDVHRQCHRRQIWLNCEDVLTSSHDRRLRHPSLQNCPSTGPLNTHTQTHPQTYWYTERQTDTHTDRQTDWQTYTHSSCDSHFHHSSLHSEYTDRHRQTDIQTHTERQTYRQSDTGTGKRTVRAIWPSPASVIIANLFNRSTKQTDLNRQTERERERERDEQTNINTQVINMRRCANIWHMFKS